MKPKLIPLLIGLFLGAALTLVLDRTYIVIVPENNFTIRYNTITGKAWIRCDSTNIAGQWRAVEE